MIAMLSRGVFLWAMLGASPDEYFEIQVVDAQTGRGIPLVELTTVDQVTYVTDNAGRVAFSEPGCAGQTLFFSIKSAGYAPKKDGFGFPGVRLRIEPGKVETIAVPRTNLAERLYRCTGQGLYRDSVLLGHTPPLKQPLGAGMVCGQDSVFTVDYRGKLWWFWGDTSRLSYPLGNFRMSGATTPPAAQLRPDVGLDFDYFVDGEGFSRPMAELPEKEGVVWLDGFAVVADDEGSEVLVAHYSRRKSLAEAVEQGLMRFNDARGLFERITTLPLTDTWRFVRDHPLTITEGDETYLMCGNPFPVTRVKKRLADILDPAAYESWSCIEPSADPEKAAPLRNDKGELDWQWRKGPPVTQQVESRWLKEGKIEAAEARYFPVDADSLGRHVLLHAGTVNWNPHRQRWVMIANEIAFDKNSPSFLGEVFYSEAPAPQGPWKTAVKVVTHDKQSFYNPYHHVLFDEQEGRILYFEGTYCNTFTESPPTPRYNYNQVMYRLDVDTPRLREVFGEAGEK